LLYFNPLYHVIEGYTLLPDHADATLFYALPPAPQLAVNEQGDPSFSLLQFLGGTGSQRLEGGLLTLSLELHIPDETLVRLAAKLRAKQDAPGDLRVIPVLFDDGAVELVALGATSAAAASTDASAEGATAPALAARPVQGPFSVQFLGTGKPSLGNRNTATFQLVLDAPAAELLERTLEAPDQPIIAIYRLGFAGLRPNFHINIEADWHKLYKTLQNTFKANVYYVSADADVKVDKALEESGIHIDTAVFGTGAGAQAAADRARKQLVDWIFERLFEPLVDQKAAMANAVGQVIDGTITSLARAVLPGVSYKLRVMEEEQLRTLSARMNESVGERREVVPQGTIGGLLQRFRVGRDGAENPAWQVMRKRLVQKVNLEGFPRIEVQVAVEDRFTSDGIARMEVELSRVNAAGMRTHSRAFAFRSAQERESYAVNLLGEAEPRLQTPYQYRYTVHFDPASRFGFHQPVSADWQDGRSAELFVEPRSPQTYNVRTVQVALAPTFSFSQFATVTVELRAGADNAPDFQSSRAVLTEASPQSEWRYLSFGAARKPYRYRATFHRPLDRGGDIQNRWREASEDWLSIPDPLPRKRTLNVITALPWAELLTAFVQIRYNDPDHAIQYEEQIDLDEQKRLLRRDIPMADDGPPTLAYRLTLLLKNGNLMEGSWRETDDDRIVLDRRSVDNRVMRVRAIGGTLRENRLSEVRVRLQVREPGRDVVRDETVMRLRTDQTDQNFPVWEYMLGDPPVKTVHYDTLFIDERGFTESTPFRPTESDVVVVNLRSKSASA
jgi:hypothetical protein